MLRSRQSKPHFPISSVAQFHHIENYSTASGLIVGTSIQINFTDPSQTLHCYLNSIIQLSTVFAIDILDHVLRNVHADRNPSGRKRSVPLDGRKHTQRHIHM